MNSVEDRVHAAMSAAADLAAREIRAAPPLRLPSGPAAGARRGHAPRRWIRWAAPLAAAVVVAALAIALVLIKDIQNGSAVPSSTAAPAGPHGVPRYYVALKQFAEEAGNVTEQNGIVVGDSLTGKTLATFAPPAHTTFQSVTAAADDRTFVVFAVTSSSGSFDLRSKATLTGSWYEVRLAPGTADPARLTRLPIKPLTVPYSYVTFGFGQMVDSFAAALSASGKELAVPEWAAPHGLAVKVFSVATGRLLHEWTTNDRSVAGDPSVAWIHGDRELALVSRSFDVPPNSKFAVDNVTVREWPVAGPASGDLVADSKVVWDVQAVKHPLTTLQSCVEPVVGGPVLISADGKTFSCTTAGGSAASDHLSFHTYPLTASTTAATQGRIDYEVTLPNVTYIPQVVWTSPSGGTLIGALIPYEGSPAAVANGPRIGMISHGTFTPLRFPPGFALSGRPFSIAW